MEREQNDQRSRVGVVGRLTGHIVLKKSVAKWKDSSPAMVGLSAEHWSSQLYPCQEGEIDNVETSTAKPDNSTADNSDVPASTMGVKERPRREAARRLDREERERRLKTNGFKTAFTFINSEPFVRKNHGRKIRLRVARSFYTVLARLLTVVVVVLN